MRILHLAKYYWPRSGGMERVVQDLAEGAATLGHEVSVVAVESRVGGRVDGRQRSTVTRVFSFGALGSQEIAPGYLTAARRRADVIHLHHPHPLADLACLLRSRRTPLVVTQHADGSSRTTARSPGRCSGAPRPSWCRAGRTWRSRPSCWASKPRWKSFPSASMRRAGPMCPRRPRAPGPGHLHRPPGAYKGLDILLRALEQVPDLRLDIVGPGRRVRGSRPWPVRWPSQTGCAGTANTPMTTCPAAWPTPISWSCPR